jgi:imidazolonepropionase
MRELRVVEDAALAVADGKVAWCGPLPAWRGVFDRSHDCGGAAVVPALTDPHTHAVWAGDRLADFEARASGYSYERILAGGGGIRSTVRETAATPVEKLVELALPRLEALARSGASVVEVKSGYGFEPEAEIRMLEAIQTLAGLTAARLLATLLIHIPASDDAERTPYLKRVIGYLIPETARRQLASCVDVFVEKEAWSASEAERIVDCARSFHLPFKLHTEQFHRIGGLELGLRKGALSLDHLEACTAEQLKGFAGVNTVATLLPGVTLHLGIPAAPGRRLIDAGAAVAVGTDLNPGSSPLFSMSMALALAVRLNGLTPAEALTAGTVNAAAALGRADGARLEAGQTADFLVLHGSDWRDLVYTLGANAVREVWIGGTRISG